MLSSSMTTLHALPHSSKWIVQTYAGCRKMCCAGKLYLLSIPPDGIPGFFVLAEYRASLSSPGWHSDQYKVQLHQSCCADVFRCQWRQRHVTELVETAAAFASDKQVSKLVNRKICRRCQNCRNVQWHWTILLGVSSPTGRTVSPWPWPWILKVCPC